MDILFNFGHQPLRFSRPTQTVVCHDPAGLPGVFQRVERWLRAGHYVAGFFSYEAGYAFEQRLADPRPRAFPLAMLGAYPPPERRPFAERVDSAYCLDDIRIRTPRSRYAEDIRRIRRYISRGDVYQITYCMKMGFRFSGDPRALFFDLYRHQPVPYAAYLDAKTFQILSLSPERFLRKRGEAILSEPMKGTWPRGTGPAADRRAQQRFQRDRKNRAENVMIADLLRNDLGRIGTCIRAPKLFTVTPYRTLFQMTSTVTGKVPSRLRLHDLLAAVFPSGSVTGAPKIRAMQIIRELEVEERKIYTGAIGYITPNRDLYFNIPIRTLLISGGFGEMGVGGGIVWDSTVRGEWAEGLLKARFLSDVSGAPICATAACADELLAESQWD
ncbi:MAG: aminodeoxychorismate synthase component I [candidate division FCPU426 bacterium]